MTTDRIALQQLLEKGSDADLQREMIGFVAERLMALEVESLSALPPHPVDPANLQEVLAMRDLMQAGGRKLTSWSCPSLIRAPGAAAAGASRPAPPRAGQARR